jgi:hypothetical protein
MPNSPSSWTHLCVSPIWAAFTVAYADWRLTSKWSIPAGYDAEFIGTAGGVGELGA